MSKKIDKIPSCKICGSPTESIDDLKWKVTYDICHICDFISKQEQYYISPEEEQKRYEQHNNDTYDPGYIKRFEDMIKLHVKPLKRVEKVLDFGSGPYPMLTIIMKEKGYETVNYDPFFAPSKDYKNHKYDLIILSEVVEHIAKPKETIEELVSLLNPEGAILFMTEQRTMPSTDFLNWWYKRDNTHISFFNTKTFEYIAKMNNMKIVSNNHKNIIVLQK